MVSRVAEAESWRKEVHRPATHTHKWWAQRLGSVFRSILAASVTESSAEASAVIEGGGPALTGLTVLDPFAGSGTTLFEAAKLGASPVGMDINPVATLVQRQALQRWNLDELERGYKLLEAGCRDEIDRLHRTAAGESVLYYFWIATATCPECSDSVRLFSRHVFAQHAYPKRFRRAHAVCPYCLAIVETTADFDEISCPRGHLFVNKGAVSGSRMVCHQGHVSKIIDALRGRRPGMELYAKLVVSSSGRKRYEAIDAFDRRLAREATDLLTEKGDGLVLPAGDLETGYNTRQAISWGYRSWTDFFNDRQLYCLGVLAAAIRDLDIAPAEREALAALFSGTLEFNNLFCSFKGEGTGAVRHMFSHHILKPERMVLEAHPWGTPWSSGSFSTLYKSRLLRAHAHKAQPADLLLAQDGSRVRRTGISLAADLTIVGSWPRKGLSANEALVATKDASQSGLPDRVVDLIITDPPYMDNVHYSELADFFHAWLSGLRPFDGYPVSTHTTRTAGEVQSTTVHAFQVAIQSVWTECRRVSKPDALLAFTFHQARIEGWLALMASLRNAGWQVSAVQPVTGEMSTSITKAGAREPSSLDSVVVCRHSGSGVAVASTPTGAAAVAKARLQRLIDGGVSVGAGDIRSVVRGTVLALATAPGVEAPPSQLVQEADNLASKAIEDLLNL